MSTSTITCAQRITQLRRLQVDGAGYTGSVTVARESSDLALEVTGASRRLQDRQVLHDVTLRVPRGSLVAIAGPNGAGKSSLLRAIGGRLAIDSGVIRIAGLDGSAARRAGRLGVVPQDLALNTHLSVRENLRLWSVLAGTPRSEVATRIAAGLAWIGLADRAGSRVDELSGGMRRRVNLLAGLLHRPALLLLDEPTVGVDKDSRERFYALLDDLRLQGVGVLLATHELDEAGAHCDTVVVLDQGAVVAAGSLAALVPPGGGEVVVVPASDAGDEVLRAEGFAPAHEREWVRDAGGAVDLADLDRRLAARGVAVAEVRLRRPTLQGAVARVIARHRERAS
jgi:ABC-2 type transport system ATP-binding protein